MEPSAIHHRDESTGQTTVLPVACILKSRENKQPRMVRAYPWPPNLEIQVRKQRHTQPRQNCTLWLKPAYGMLLFALYISASFQVRFSNNKIVAWEEGNVNSFFRIPFFAFLFSRIYEGHDTALIPQPLPPQAGKGSKQSLYPILPHKRGSGASNPCTPCPPLGEGQG